jgi:hypothetical protein
MLVDSAQVLIPAGATVNAFQGRPMEFIGAPSVARLLVIADTGGLTVSWTINVAGMQHVPIASGTSINVSQPSTGYGPREDEDELATNVPMPAGSRNSLTVSNTGAGAVASSIRYRATILP